MRFYKPAKLVVKPNPLIEPNQVEIIVKKIEGYFSFLSAAIKESNFENSEEHIAKKKMVQKNLRHLISKAREEEADFFLNESFRVTKENIRTPCFFTILNLLDRADFFKEIEDLKLIVNLFSELLEKTSKNHDFLLLWEVQSYERGGRSALDSIKQAVIFGESNSFDVACILFEVFKTMARHPDIDAIGKKIADRKMVAIKVARGNAEHEALLSDAQGKVLVKTMSSFMADQNQKNQSRVAIVAATLSRRFFQPVGEKTPPGFQKELGLRSQQQASI